MRTFKEISSQLLTILQHPILKRGVVIVLLLPFILASFWFISFGFFMGWVSLGLFVFALYKYNSSIPKALLFIALWFGINLVFLPFTINCYNKTTDHYYARIQKGERLSFRENCNIYGMNIVMAAGGYFIYPEVATETFLEMFPTKNRVREYESDFFMDSYLIQKVCKGRDVKKKILSWKYENFEVSSHEARFALALNQGTITVQSTKRNDGRTSFIEKEITVTAPVDYFSKANITLVSFPIKIQVQEGLFDYLEKIGWLYTYTAVYKTKYITPANSRKNS